MKNIFYILFLFFIVFISTSSAAHTTADPFVLVLDAGHGGKDSGALGKKGKEKNINLAVTLLAGKYIAEKYPDVKVIYTRETDVFVGLDDRAAIANKSKANLFISVHTNSAPGAPSARGLEVFAFGVARTEENLDVVKRENAVIYLEDNYQEKYEGFDPNSSESYIIFEFMQNKFVEQSLDFASTVCNELKSCASWRDRGVKQAGFLVLRKSSMPRILIELDFISNAGAEALLLSDAGQKKYAKAIFNAFAKYKADYDRKNGIQSTPQKKETKKVVEEAVIVETKEVSRKEAASHPTVTNDNRTIYKVQILAVPKKLPANARDLKGYKADYYIENNRYKYTYGETTDVKEIARIRKSLLKDFKDAFIVVFEDGEKVKIIKGNP
ncbi:N-acetylmuramoyl-L-alanine amidase [Bacteroidia bacterium]|nr:N-acetylmuramoyl-L-alanine amidase [Bacteroidia bacterium]